MLKPVARNRYSQEHKYFKLVLEMLWEDPGHLVVTQGNL